MEQADARIAYKTCPLCDGSDAIEECVADCSHHPLYSHELPKAQRWLRCRQCDHVYVDGYFSKEAQDLLFSGGHTYQTPGQEIENTRYISARMVEVVCELLPASTGRWLDIGFGNGSLMTTAAEFGFQVVGLDMREPNIKLMREYGFEAHAVEFEKYQPSELFDVISMADVLEHMSFPKGALRHAHELLREGGLIFLSMPNSDSFLWSFLSQEKINPYWGELEHYHNFGRRRLYSLLEECGFKPLRYGVSARYRACMEVVAQKSLVPEVDSNDQS